MAQAARAFADPVFDGQRVFRAVMDALARPGRIVSLDVECAPPAPLPPGLAAVALALADADAPLWLDASLASDDVAAYLRFHTGARIVAEAAGAAFALIGDPAGCPAPEAFEAGDPDYPDRSTTLVIALDRIEPEGDFVLAGPGIAGRGSLGLHPPVRGLLALMRANAAGFPLGLDCLFVAPGALTALPRSTRLVREG